MMSVHQALPNHHIFFSNNHVYQILIESVDHIQFQNLQIKQAPLVSPILCRVTILQPSIVYNLSNEFHKSGLLRYFIQQTGNLLWLNHEDIKEYCYCFQLMIFGSK